MASNSEIDSKLNKNPEDVSVNNAGGAQIQDVADNNEGVSQVNDAQADNVAGADSALSKHENHHGDLSEDHFMDKGGFSIDSIKEKILGLFGKGSSKQFNLIIGFDAVHSAVRVMNIDGLNISTIRVDVLPVEKELYTRGNWVEIVKSSLEEYLSTLNTEKSYAAYLVMPNNTVASDIVTIPMMKKSNIVVNLDAQLGDLYFFYKDYIINRFTIASNKTNVTFELVMIKKALLNDIYKQLNEFKFYIKETTYTASSALNAVFALRPKTRKQSFIFIDIHADYTVYSICANGITIGYSTLPFGYKILYLDKVELETNLYDNDLVNLVVVNATAAARQKELFVLGGGAEENEGAVDENANPIPATDGAVAAENVNADGQPTAENATMGLNAGQPAVATQPVDEDDELETPVVETPVIPTKAAPKQKVYTKKVKKLPKFMQRPTPHTPDDFMVENFRPFVKKALLIKQRNEQTEYLTNPDFVLVNMPEQYSFIIDAVNKDENGIQFRYFHPGKENNDALADNLDLYGALFAHQYNKPNNL